MKATGDSSLGIFRLDCEVVSIGNSSRSSIVSHLLVDTGSELTWVPEASLHQVKVQIVKKDLPFLMEGKKGDVAIC